MKQMTQQWKLLDLLDLSPVAPMRMITDWTWQTPLGKSLRVSRWQSRDCMTPQATGQIEDWQGLWFCQEHLRKLFKLPKLIAVQFVMNGVLRNIKSQQVCQRQKMFQTKFTAMFLRLMIPKVSEAMLSMPWTLQVGIKWPNVLKTRVQNQWSSSSR